MAHYAKLDENNIVTEVNVIDNEVEDAKGVSGTIDWLLVGWGGSDWKKTSYNTHGNIHIFGGIPLRKNYAGVGFTFDSERDAFIPPQTFSSWVLNEDTCQWDSPVSYPDDSKDYRWDEDTENWVLAEPSLDTE
jgi:hypothetical protein